MMHVAGILFSIALLPGQPPNVRLEDPAVISRGSAIFSSSCGIGYCHGKEGQAGRGPRLAGKKWDREYLFKVTSEGLGTLMPPFKNQLSTSEIWSVVAYVLSLTPDGVPREEPGTAPPPLQHPPPERQPPIHSPNAGDPESGRAIFFDSSNPKRCAACHLFQGRGADVGPDLTQVSDRAPRAILHDILEPDARLAVEPLSVLTKSGERVTGVKKQETREVIRIYDTRSLPPVLRTIYKDQVETVTPEKHSPMPAGYGRAFTPKQLLDLVAFLKSAPVAPEDVEPTEPK